ncbi:MAG: leucine-rich repeat protein, partial [Lachnospiraceae bacterium]
EASANGSGEEKLTYQVDSNNQLQYFSMTGPVEEVTIPAKIGPYGISSINSGSFSNNCFLKKITIPATVTAINDGAFKGCHNLEHVIFSNAAGITYIGTDAFATQVVEGAHASGCSGLSQTPKLTFTGAVGTGIKPFDYAMNKDNYINYGTQNRTYITYYSGWPTNLEIRYVENQTTGTGTATLVDYPTFSELVGGTKYTEANYPYMTEEYADAATEAVTNYNGGNPTSSFTDYQRQIIDAALRVSVPSGVKAIDTGLFSGVTGIKQEDGTYSVTPVSGQSPDTTIQEITLADVTEIEPYTFSGCKALNSITITGGAEKIDDYAFAYDYTTPGTNGGDGQGSDSLLSSFIMTGGGGSIGDYAFCNNKVLNSVTISPAVSTMGLRPFKDCPLLENVGFSGSPYFMTDSAIIYGLSNGSKDSVVQCLESRGNRSTKGTVSAAELSGINSIAEEAFMDCEDIGSVDMSSSNITGIPESAFENTTSLYSATIPTTCKSISERAFWDSNVRYVDIPSSVTYIAPSAFTTLENPAEDGSYNTIEFYCEPGSAAETYANMYTSIDITDKPLSTTFTVIFWNQDGSIIDSQEVLIYEDATAPEAPSLDGYRFTGWLPADFTNVSRNMDVVAQYEKIDSEELKHTVRFFDYDGREIGTQRVATGEDAVVTSTPTREGYRFVGWMPAVTNITADLDTYAQYEKIDSEETKFTVTFIDYDDTVLYTQRVAYGEDAILPQNPTREGYTFTGWRPAITDITRDTDTYAQYEPIGSGTPTPDPGTATPTPDPGTATPTPAPGTSTPTPDPGGTATPTPAPNTTLYTLTVRNGSGSGSYAAGATVIIVADNPSSTQEFSKWTTDNDKITFASNAVTATTLVMPAENATVTANYVEKSTGNNSNNGSNSGSSSGNNSGTSGNSNGTVVVIDKNGLSNTGVVSVTVKGSSDNFTLKISEDASASEAVVKALLDEYGSLDNIKYFPMDISLYDSTGKTKITDTSGLSISITLPLPDSLITYAGNNKVAGVVNDKLDKLTPKFTTIDGVSCITFTAEHFSPYVIYVDTQNLSSTTVIDNSPKTGDIHPKWFVVIGLTCVAMVLFMKKDRTGKRVAVQ